MTPRLMRWLGLIVLVVSAFVWGWEAGRAFEDAQWRRSAIAHDKGDVDDNGDWQWRRTSIPPPRPNRKARP